MQDYLSKQEVNGFTVKLFADQDPESPRDWTHGAELVYGHRRYNFPNDASVDFDDYAGWAELAESLRTNCGALLVLPVYMMDHSGLSFRVGDDFGTSVHAQWDSGQVGVVYVTQQNWADTQGTEWTGSDEDLAQARKLAESDVEVYGQYVNGDVLGYEVTDFDGEVVDSCWGLYGWQYAESEAVAAAEAAVHEPKCTGSLNRATGEVDHDGPCPVHNLTPELEHPAAPDGAPKWNCVSYPGEGMHYVGSGRTCLWCGQPVDAESE